MLATPRPVTPSHLHLLQRLLLPLALPHPLLALLLGTTTVLLLHLLQLLQLLLLPLLGIAAGPAPAATQRAHDRRCRAMVDEGRGGVGRALARHARKARNGRVLRHLRYAALEEAQLGQRDAQPVYISQAARAGRGWGEGA